MNASAAGSLWVDVTTLLGQRGAPTGIPRTLSQILRHWLTADSLPVRLCAFDRTFGTCAEVSRDDPQLASVLQPVSREKVTQGICLAPPTPKASLLFPLVQACKSGYRTGRRVARQLARPLFHAIGQRRQG